MELLRVEHLSRYYGEGPAQVKALDDVSFAALHTTYFSGINSLSIPLLGNAIVTPRRDIVLI